MCNYRNEGNINRPNYYDFLIKDFGFKFDGGYYTKTFRDGYLQAMYYVFKHQFRILTVKGSDIVEWKQCRYENEIRSCIYNWGEELVK